MEGINKITARIIEDAEREIALMQQENEDKINIVKDGVCVKKMRPQLPERLTNIIQCKNPRCITSVEQEIPHIFKLTNREKGEYRCIYCESKAKN